MIRMADIAKSVGVARSTVSAVLNDQHRKLGIKIETARRIRATAEKLGYFRNEMAVAVKTGQNAVIGCITVGLNREWVARVITGLLHTSQEAGYLIKIVNIDIDSPESSLDSLSRLVRQRMAGIFCCDVHPPGAMAREFRDLCARYRMPIVAINSADGIGGYHLRSDDLQGTDLAIRYLWKLGHRRIGHITGDPDSMTGQWRRQGFVRAVKRCGGTVPGSLIAVGSYDHPEVSADAARQLLDRKSNRPTAIFCANDEVAATTLHVAHGLGLQVPRDVSVVGYSNIKVSQLTSPHVTTIAQPFERMGERGAKVLLGLISRPQKPRFTVELLPTKLVIRDSTEGAPSST